MKSLYDIPAPAKLNLFLHIVGRRADGYHLLESVFMLIDWVDTLHFELRDDGHISREDLSVPLPQDDLVVRAAHALQKLTGTRFGAHIAIDKRIPSQAGLGGGSSDAASTLLALNRLWQLNLGLDALLPLGLALGADVPFFLGGRNAWVSGIGEKMAPIALPPAQFLVVKPADGLATQRIFSHPQLKRDTEPAILSGFAADAYGFGCNDLQGVAQQICPDVSQALAWLSNLGLNGRMTGSGSAVFARTLQDMNIPAPPGFQVKQCNNLPVHPLEGWAA
ncbi:MAG: 4-(cytidine 5'-diphospho)-2-C-methyl-D-erythritol kinase [Rhodoferax sp.]|uniref:4-(cytidine 5'-diphospho)-2-C-methyl-D-erythritol kinase n=1 Tax=Rhodoferax sp. TaxID=50421 RepID=UPI00262B9D8B|nr:4-(cytidine 5'-diphospho)-2-C-methyl-D-erythritol kinase [Rhodoferax sp.]MDD2882681.1 4-(cytidine 5'-diphospho)-2-C-methyl-D-erythritol kinase [Rhodoferax sp.]